MTRGDPCPTCDKVLTDCPPDPEVLKSLFGKSLWTPLYHFFTYKVFTEYLLCANSFMAYGDESNRPGLCHRDDDHHLCPLPPWDPPSGPLSEMSTICAHFADVIIKQQMGAGV